VVFPTPPFWLAMDNVVPMLILLSSGSLPEILLEKVGVVAENRNEFG